ncbi:hypothetical protein HK101_007953 [Irineochytrium annulatum]|nr:hypothetical protein HK101_007953 [Irineochytrium annulatum]
MATPDIAISGGGVAGLVLALGLKRHMGLTPTVYEQAPSFDDNVGGAMGMYANGLRIIRDISPELLKSIRSVARPYNKRRWMRHDGTEVAVAEERYLCQWESVEDERDLSSIGLRRWRLQKALADACEKEGIAIKFNRRVMKLVKQEEDGTVVLELSDGSVVRHNLVFGCDGVRSVLRGALFPQTEPSYTGVTCLMGAAQIPRHLEGISFPSSSTTKCHACYYPTGDSETIFQIYFPTPERPETWKALSREEAKKECKELAEKLKADGWDSQFTDPILASESVLRVGLRARAPIPVWHSGRICLLGDAAHPPVPYIGQGAMMAIEDVGVLLTILKALCHVEDGNGGRFSFDHLETAFVLYESLRVPRTTSILENSAKLGEMQLLRTGNPSSKEVAEKEESIVRDVHKYGTMPIMKSGASYNYMEHVSHLLAEHIVKRAKANTYLQGKL